MARKSRKNPTIENDILEKVFKTAIYARLSNLNETEVIDTQIQICKEYIEKRPHFKLIDIYADNGFTGVNFERPEFERLMEDIRNNLIDCIIVKDLSRFGRNHIAIGDYINNIFPFLGVRFIAISDNYDNINIEPEEYFLASFKNLVNAFFAAETSRKVSESKHKMQEEGKFVGAFAPYGYKKAPMDKHKLVIDEETAPIVRLIFQLAYTKTCSEIAEYLNAESIPIPRGTGIWNATKVGSILRKETYIGTMTSRILFQSLYKGEPQRLVPKNERLRFEDNIPPIIDKETFRQIREIFEKRRLKNIAKTPKNTDKRGEDN
jgi:DNA invertase Pin-like site-specific DNA recombinase